MAQSLALKAVLRDLTRPGLVVVVVAAAAAAAAPPPPPQQGQARRRVRKAAASFPGQRRGRASTRDAVGGRHSLHEDEA